MKLLLGPLGILFALSIPCGAGEGSPVAVLDFVMEGHEKLEDSWAVGVADFVEIGLLEAGVAVIERRQIRLLLAERDLAHAGITRTITASLGVLPRAGYFVSGTIRRTPPDDFHLHLTLVDVGSGKAAATADAEGKYPQDLLPATGRLAAKLAQELGRKRAVVKIRKVAGFTATPEIAHLFYKGVAHMAAGRVEYAIPYLARARNADPRFLVAAVWEMKCFETCGMTDHARLVRSKLGTSRVGRSLLKATAAGTDRGDGRLVVLISGKGGIPAEFLRGVKTVLSEDRRISFAEAMWITDISREHDLELTGQFEQGNSVPYWFAVDAFLSCRADTSGADRSFKIVLQDSLTGRVLASTVVRPPGTASQEAGTAAGRRLLESLTEKTAAGAVMVPEGRKDQRTELAIGDAPERKFRDVALAIRRLRKAPDNLEAIAEWRSAFFNYASVNHDVHHRMLPLKRIIALIDRNRDLPLAPYWLDYALYNRSWFMRWSLPPKKRKELALSKAYKELLEWYPDSIPAKLVHYQRAHQLMYERKSAEAATVFVRLAGDPDLRKTGTHPQRLPGAFFEINLDYWTARALSETGDKEGAKPYAEKAMAATRSVPKGREIKPILSCHYSSVYNGSPNACSLAYSTEKERMETAISHDRDIRPAIEALEKALLGTDEVATAATAWDLYQKATRATGSQMLGYHLESFRAFLAEEQAGIGIPAWVVQQTAWLALHKQNQAVSAEYDELVNGLLARIDQYSGTASRLVFGERLALLAMSGRIQAAADHIARYFKKMIAAPADTKSKLSASGFRSHVDALCDMVDFYSMTQPPEKAAAILSRMLSEYCARHADVLAEERDSLRLALAVGRRLVAHGHVSKADELYKAEYARRGNTSSDRTAVAYELGLLESGRGRLFKATEYLREVSEGQNKKLVAEALVELKKIRHYAMFSDVAPPNKRPRAEARSDQAVGSCYALTRLLAPDVNSFWRDRAAARLSSPDRLHELSLILHKRPISALRSVIKLGAKAHPLVAEVTGLLRSVEYGPRGNAAIALSRIGKTARVAIPALILCAEDDNSGVLKQNARHALRRLGRAPRSTIPNLIFLLDHENERVRTRAADAVAAAADPEIPGYKNFSAGQRAAAVKAWWNTTGTKKPVTREKSAASD